MSDINGLVEGIQGVPVSNAMPNVGDTLVFDGAQWVPGTPPGGLEPWVGSVDTQAQIIRRIPFTCRVLGTTPVSTGVSFTLPTDTAMTMNVQVTARVVSATNKNSVFMGTWFGLAKNDGGTIGVTAVTVASQQLSAWPSGLPFPGLAISGTTVTLEAALTSGSATVDLQGFVDLMSV